MLTTRSLEVLLSSKQAVWLPAKLKLAPFSRPAGFETSVTGDIPAGRVFNTDVECWSYVDDWSILSLGAEIQTSETLTTEH